jgi:hypothetical protein
LRPGIGDFGNRGPVEGGNPVIEPFPEHRMLNLMALARHRVD